MLGDGVFEVVLFLKFQLLCHYQIILTATPLHMPICTSERPPSPAPTEQEQAEHSVLLTDVEKANTPAHDHISQVQEQSQRKVILSSKH